MPETNPMDRTHTLSRRAVACWGAGVLCVGLMLGHRLANSNVERARIAEQQVEQMRLDLDLAHKLAGLDRQRIVALEDLVTLANPAIGARVRATREASEARMAATLAQVGR